MTRISLFTFLIFSISAFTGDSSYLSNAATTSSNPKTKIAFPWGKVDPFICWVDGVVTPRNGQKEIHLANGQNVAFRAKCICGNPTAQPVQFYCTWTITDNAGTDGALFEPLVAAGNTVAATKDGWIDAATGDVFAQAKIEAVIFGQRVPMANDHVTFKGT